MRYYCFYFPTLAIDLARRPGGGREERPMVLIQGHGDEAVVTAASPLARARGAFTGMTAGQARSRCGSALFLSDNAGVCLDELERFAAILRRYATDNVAICGRDHIIMQIDGPGNPLTVARSLLALARSWFKHEARVGGGWSPELALESARVARRTPVVDDRPAEGDLAPLPLSRDQEISGAASVRGEGPVALRREIFRLLTRLELLLAGAEQGFRTVGLEVECEDGIRRLNLRFDNPAYGADDVIRRLEQHLHSPRVANGRHVRITLGRLCPDVRQRAIGEPALRAAG